MSKYLAILCSVLLFMAGSLNARPIGQRTATPVVLDTGGCAGGIDLTVGATTTVLLSSAAVDAERIWRIRTFQVTDAGGFNLHMASFTPVPNLTGSGNGSYWIVDGSTGSFSTRSQAAYYGRMAPGSSSATVRGPYEWECGERPSQ